MSKLQLKKEHWNKKRFVFTPLFEAELWYEKAQEFSRDLSENSQYQRVTNKVFIKRDLSNKNSLVGFEVIGVFDQRWLHDEFSDIDHLIYELPKEAKEWTFIEMDQRAEQIWAALGKKVSNIVYFQLDEGNLALHFFYQKDYSQVNINNA